MAAISALYFGLLKSGDHILLPSDGYYTTRVLAERFLRPMGISFDTRPTASFLDDRFDGYRLVFIETPSNPGLYICDMQAVCEAAHAAGAIVADTKAPNGHSDALFGHPDSTRVAQARRRNTRIV